MRAWLKKDFTPFRYLLSLFTIYITVCFVQRLVYTVWIAVGLNTSVENLSVALAKGLVFDVLSGLFLFLLPAVLLIVSTSGAQTSKIHRRILTFLTAFPFLIAFFMILSEGFFFQEFHSRFNFIAVDYLVYSQEVIKNAMESYPVIPILSALFVFWLGFAFGIWRLAGKIRYPLHMAQQRVFISLLFCFLAVPFYLLDEEIMISKEPYWTRETSKNSLYTIFTAYHRNTIDFHEFYSTLPTDEAHHIAHEWLEEHETDHPVDGVHEALSEDETSVIRNIKSNTPKKDWNVVLVIIESMSARYLHHYGNQNPITPNLDRLADEGLFFQKLYATGTRTVRGLEALLLSLPPTPGQSIIRRPHSDDIFNLGEVFRQKGYATQFIYGGYSYFDNMKTWFSSNGFEIVDRSTFPDSEIHFGNAWGVCDENLFDQVLKQGDRLTAEKKPFFQAILTTSNHRPYTFPDGRIDIPSHSGRNGAIKYTDFAIGRFVEDAKKKPWFKNTVFVFVADHDASVAGGADILVDDYLIPLIIYNPGLIPAQKVDKIASQIDFAPTLLGLLGFSYQSRFFGQDLMKAKGGRAVLGTYQKIALMEPGQMTILAPGHSIESQVLDPAGKMIKTNTVYSRDASGLPDQVKKTVAVYQTASDLFTSGQDRNQHQVSAHANNRGY